jgi:YfiH family protein
LIPVDLGPGARSYFTTNQFDLATVEGRAALSDAVGLPLAFVKQVHGDRLCWVDQPTPDPARYPTGDALGSRQRGIGLVIRTADCVPVLLADPERGLVAAVHVGWRGLMSDAVRSALAEVAGQDAGALRAAVGPAICGDCYQVGEDLAAEARRRGHVTGTSADGSARLDVAASVVAQLRRGGIERIEWVRECTRESERFFSWRRDRSAGRQGAVIALADPTGANRP